MFEVPDTHPQGAAGAGAVPRSTAPVPAVAELLALDRLREFSGAPFDPALTRGNVSARSISACRCGPICRKARPPTISPPTSSNFSAEQDDVQPEGRSADAARHRQQPGLPASKATCASAARRRRSSTAGSRASRRPRSACAATLDDAARSRLGLNFGTAITGPLPFKLNGRVSDTETQPPQRRGRSHAAQGRQPAAGMGQAAGQRGARDLHVRQGQGRRCGSNDLLIDGPGILARGNVELDANGDMQTANFPVFATSDGDKVTLRADRASDGALRVVMRGDVYDGRTFVKSSMSGPPTTRRTRASRPTSISTIKVGVVAGHHGEALRGLDLRMSRRNGRVRSFSLNAKIGRDTALIGDMRTRTSQRPPGDVLRDQRRRRAVPLHRRLSAHRRRQDLGGDGSADAGQRAAGRPDQPARLLDPRRERARKRGVERAARPAQRRRVHRRRAPNSPARRAAP